MLIQILVEHMMSGNFERVEQLLNTVHEYVQPLAEAEQPPTGVVLIPPPPFETIVMGDKKTQASSGGTQTVLLHYVCADSNSFGKGGGDLMSMLTSHMSAMSTTETKKFTKEKARALAGNTSNTRVRLTQQ